MNLQFFSMIPPIGKIFNLANYDFKNNFKSWLKLLSMQAIVIATLLLYRFLPGSFMVFCPDIFFGVGSFKCVLGEEYFSLAWNLTSVLMCTKIVIAILSEYLLHILFPIMILQNALDLAFDSTMRGFAIKGPLMLYVVAVHAFYLCRNLIVDYSSNGLIQIYQICGTWSYGLLIDTTILILFILGLCVYLGLFVYAFQILRFVGLHLFEYNAGIKKSVQASYEMTRGKILFLSMISLVQLFGIIGMLIVSLYLAKFGIYILNILLKIIPLNLLSVDMFSFAVNSFTIIFSAIFWSLLMAWYYLVEAHTYRQLVCPAVDKPVCESCECGS